MANEQNLKKWKKGQSGNPKGRPKMPKDIRELRKMTVTDFNIKLLKYMNMDLPAIEKIQSDKKTKMLDRFIASVILEGIANGDSKRLEFLIDRTLGKMPIPVAIEGELKTKAVDDPKTRMKKLTDPKVKKALEVVTKNLGKRN